MTDAAPRPHGAGGLVPATAWCLLLLGLWLWAQQLTDGSPSGAGAGAGPALGAQRQVDESALPPAVAPMPGSPAPVRVEIPALGVRAGVIARGVDATGGVDPPPFDTPELTGWYRDGPTPGAEGAAVVVGHVDTRSEPAVFRDLSTVEPGSEVTVTRKDGSMATFTVEDVEVVDRRAFDADRVYGPRAAGRAELRLLTCGGTYDAELGRYSANVVVSAYLTDDGT